MVSGSILPTALWGTCVFGLSPSEVQHLRAMTSYALGQDKRQQCSTTTLALLLGQVRDPLVSLAVETVMQWMQILAFSPAFRTMAERPWQHTLQKVREKGWRAVSGPLGSVVATLF